MPSHQLGDDGIVVDVHPLRLTKTSRAVRPPAMSTTESCVPWNPMYATGVVPFVQPLTDELPAIGATARPSPAQPTAFDIMPPKLNPVWKMRLWSMHMSVLNFVNMAFRNAMSWPFVFPQPRLVPPLNGRPSGETRIAMLLEVPLRP